MIDRIISVGGTLGFLLLLFFGRDLIGSFRQSGKQDVDVTEHATADEPVVRRAKQITQALNSRIRHDLVAIAREEMHLEQLSNQSQDGSLSFRMQRLAHARVQLDSFMAVNVQLFEEMQAIETLAATVVPAHVAQAVDFEHSTANHKESLSELVREIEELLASTELHFMEEVLPVITLNNRYVPISANFAKMAENHLYTQAVVQTVDIGQTQAYPSQLDTSVPRSEPQETMHDSVKFENAGHDSDIVGNAL